MAAYPGTTAITTELIQKYLDENKQLILAILDNQNLGKLNECAQYQLKLQQNLMYLAAIADAQPQPTMAPTQVAPAAMMQTGQHYMQQQHMMQQSMMGQRNPLQYMQQQQQQQQQQQPQASLHQSPHHQQSLSMQGGGMVPGGHNGMHLLSSEGNNGPSTAGGFPDFGRGNASGGGGGASGDGLQTTIRLGQDMRSGGNRSDLGVPSGNNSGVGNDGGASGGDDAEASYLKASEEDGN